MYFIPSGYHIPGRKYEMTTPKELVQEDNTVLALSALDINQISGNSSALAVVRGCSECSHTVDTSAAGHWCNGLTGSGLWRRCGELDRLVNCKV
jgi:hypothetical protein